MAIEFTLEYPMTKVSTALHEKTCSVIAFQINFSEDHGCVYNVILSLLLLSM